MRAKIDSSSENRREFFFHSDDCEQAGYVIGLELDEQVDIAVSLKLAAQGGSEQGQLTDMVPSTKVSDHGPVDVESRHDAAH